MTVSLALLGLVTLAGAAAAVALRNLVHCALALAAALAGLAGLYLALGAQFVGFAQVLVYLGAVAILVVFAILLTRGSEPAGHPVFSPSWAVGAGIAAASFGVLGCLVLRSRAIPVEAGPAPAAAVKEIGEQLMTRYILPLEVLGLLLTAALIGAVLIAMRDRGPQ